MPPGARSSWLREAGDFVTDQWEGKTVIEGATVAQGRPDEWLLVEAWVRYRVFVSGQTSEAANYADPFRCLTAAGS